MIKTYTPVCSTSDNDGYSDFEKIIADRCSTNKQLFTTNVNKDELWNTYLMSLPAYNRQHYNCNCCKQFIKEYGGLVTIDQSTGEQTPLLWRLVGNTPDFFRAMEIRMWTLVQSASVSGVYYTAESTWGKPQTGDWTHLCGRVTPNFSSAVKTTYQAAAEKLEEYKMLFDSFSICSDSVLNTALQILRHDALTRSEKFESMAQWLLETYTTKKKYLGRGVSNYLWTRVASAPVGYCHWKNTMLGTLVDDIVSKYKFEDIAKRWSAKMHPLQYQRPTAAPTAGNVQRAQELFDKLGLAPALNRRVAKLADIPDEVIFWKPTTVATKKVPKPGLFTDLIEPAKTAPMIMAPVVMTWRKFSTDVLPYAVNITVRVPEYGNFYGLTTATDPTAPPLLQWDRENKRNPFSWYFYHGGSSRTNWGLTPITKVLAMFTCPANWYGATTYHNDKVFIVLERSRDSRLGTLGLFPETLRSELREVRSVIEAYSNKNVITDSHPSQQNASGIAQWPLTFEVQTGDYTYQTITVDRHE